MKCPRCESTQLRKNGRSSGKQRYLCKVCGKQFLMPLSDPEADAKQGKSGRVGKRENLIVGLFLPTSTSEHPQQLGDEENQGDLAELSVPINLPELLDTPIASSGQAESALPEVSSSMLSPPEALEPSPEASATLAQSTQGIGILLLDAENLKLDINAEKFLAQLCNYPLQVKIAFANWRNPTIGKQDAELYERGYQLIHAPGGKNSADAQMIVMGASISRHYPDAKDIFVCSSDWLLTNLCNELQSQGLTVYRVRRQDTNLHIENRNSGEVNYYSLAMGMEIPSFEGFVKKIEQLLQAEYESVSARMVQLTTIATLFQERCNLTVNETSSNPSTRVEQEPSSISVVIEEKLAPSTPIDNLDTLQDSLEVEINSSGVSVNSIEEFETVILAMIQAIVTQSGTGDISVNDLRKEFQGQYKITADTSVKKIQKNSSLIKFLRSRPTVFSLTLVNKEHRVALARP